MGCVHSSVYAEAEKFLTAHGVDLQRTGHPHYWTDDQRARLQRIQSGDQPIVVRPRDEGSNKFAIELERFLQRRGRTAVHYCFFWDSFAGNPTRLQVLRCQTSGLCYMHAPVVLQHYLVTLSNPDDEDPIGMIDVAQYIRNRWKGKKLEDYLLRNMGGNSMEFLREITNNPDLNLDTFLLNQRYHRDICQTICDQLQHQPALVSQFGVDAEFLNSQEVFFHKPLDHGQFKGHHAMVMIGWRYDAVAQEYCFVLQNWWNSRYFVEVTSSYLQSTGALVSFVGEPLRAIPNEFPISHLLYAETAMDSCEGLSELSFLK